MNHIGHEKNQYLQVSYKDFWYIEWLGSLGIACFNRDQSNCPVNSNGYPTVNAYDPKYNCCKDYRVNFCCGPPKPKCHCCAPRDPPPCKGK